MLHAMTIDVEDYFHVSAFEGQISRQRWDSYPSRVVANTRKLLRLFERRQVRATFFVLGWVGHRFPGLVKEIARDGHEIACHSYWHRLIYQQTPEEFAQDLRLARTVLEDAVSMPVRAYRAPSYSITRQSLWALDILAAEGFQYDSSIFPIYHDRYGIPDAERFPHRVSGGTGELWEFPPSVMRLGRLNLPVAGGGYFRLYPVAWTAFCVEHVQRLGQPFVFYLHPWELDPGQPCMGKSRWRHWRHYLNLSSTEKKLDQLLQRCSFGCLSEVARVSCSRN